MNYKIRIKSPEHSEKVQKHLSSLGYTWYGWSTDLNAVIFVGKRFLTFDSEIKRIYYTNSESLFNNLPNREVELIETVSYELKEVPKKEVVTIGEKSYYKDELEVALKNINPI
jgi:hypothetical protein